MPAALFLSVKKEVWIQHKRRFSQQRFYYNAGSVKTAVIATSSHVLSRHAAFILAVRPRLSSPHKQLTSCFGAGCVGDKDQHCGLHSELPAGINHCQDASNPLKIPFSWVLEITSCKSSKNRMCPLKGFTACFHHRLVLLKMR